MESIFGLTFADADNTFLAKIAGYAGAQDHDHKGNVEKPQCPALGRKQFIFIDMAYKGKGEPDHQDFEPPRLVYYLSCHGSTMIVLHKSGYAHGHRKSDH